MLLNLDWVAKLGWLDAAGLDEMRHGKAATIRKRLYAGDQLNMDHIIPRTPAPKLDNVIANLEWRPPCPARQTDLILSFQSGILAGAVSSTEHSWPPSPDGQAAGGATAARDRTPSPPQFLGLLMDRNEFRHRRRVQPHFAGLRPQRKRFVRQPPEQQVRIARTAQHTAHTPGHAGHAAH